MESRVEEAVSRFESGYNCCQSVFSTYADLVGIEEAMALKLSYPLGAGVGRMREICGTITAMAMLSGLKGEVVGPKDLEGKERSYAFVRQLSDAFEKERGSIICRDLIVLTAKREESAAPEIRNQEYYQKRPCSKCVRTAAELLEKYLFTTQEN